MFESIQTNTIECCCTVALFNWKRCFKQKQWQWTGMLNLLKSSQMSHYVKQPSASACHVKVLRSTGLTHLIVSKRNNRTVRPVIVQTNSKVVRLLFTWCFALMVRLLLAEVVGPCEPGLPDGRGACSYAHLSHNPAPGNACHSEDKHFRVLLKTNINQQSNQNKPLNELPLNKLSKQTATT